MVWSVLYLVLRRLIGRSGGGSSSVTSKEITAVKTWDVSRTGDAEWANLPADARNLGGVAFTPDGRRVIASNGDGSLTVWDAETAEKSLTVGHVSPLPLHSELEILVRIEPMRIDDKLGHLNLLGGVPMLPRGMGSGNSFRRNGATGATDVSTATRPSSA